MTIFQPKFLTKNYIDAVSEISDSAGNSDQIKRALFDRNEDYQWEGESSGTRTITWTPGVSTTIDRICLQNTNFEDFTIKYNGGSDFSPAISITGNSDKNIYFEFSSQAINTVEISNTETFPNGETAKLGQLYIGEEIFEIDSGVGGRINDARPVTKQSIIPLSDGTFHKIYIRRITNWILSLTDLTEAERDNFKDLFERNRREPFFYIPYPRTQSDVWDGLGQHYNWANGHDYLNFTNGLRAAGYDCNVQLVQAGGV